MLYHVKLCPMYTPFQMSRKEFLTAFFFKKRVGTEGKEVREGERKRSGRNGPCILQISILATQRGNISLKA